MSPSPAIVIVAPMTIAVRSTSRRAEVDEQKCRSSSLTYLDVTLAQRESRKRLGCSCFACSRDDCDWRNLPGERSQTHWQSRRELVCSNDVSRFFGFAIAPSRLIVNRWKFMIALLYSVAGHSADACDENLINRRSALLDLFVDFARPRLGGVNKHSSSYGSARREDREDHRSRRQQGGRLLTGN